MNVEENRLRTFDEWPSNAAVDAARIAKAGFYYSGHGLEVQCFLCGVKVSNWDYGDQAMVRHRQAQPDCPFVINSAATCNVPLIPSPSSSTVVRMTAQTVANQTLSSRTSDKVQTIVHSSDPLREYATFAQRFQSFKNWPIPTVVSPEQLAKAGFYYLQFKDLVECAFCKGVLAKWVAGDDPDREHTLHFPNCDFYLRLQTESDTLQLANVNLVPGSPTNLKKLRIQTHRSPSNPMYRTYEERLRTFSGWPSHLTQTPEMLATAGFYFTGYQDQVRCFHCDGGLRNWEPQDDVWFEHARWFPACTFVNLVRGPEFIKQCIANRPPLDPQILNDVPNQESEDVTGMSIASVSMASQSYIHLNDISNEEDSGTVTSATEMQQEEIPMVMQNVLHLSDSNSLINAPNEENRDNVESKASLPSIPQFNTHVNDALDEENRNIARAAAPTSIIPRSDVQVITDSQITRLLNTAPALTALEIGLPVNIIKKILKKRMEEYSENYISAEELIEDVLNDETSEEYNSVSTSPSSESITRVDRVVAQAIDDASTSITNETNHIRRNSSDNNEVHNDEEHETKMLSKENKLEQNETKCISNNITLQEENRRLKEARLCKICMDKDLSIVFLPCGHLATCFLCAPSLVYCPMCRVKIRASVRIFLP